jgi:hypothetical protein
MDWTNGERYGIPIGNAQKKIGMPNAIVAPAGSARRDRGSELYFVTANYTNDLTPIQFLAPHHTSLCSGLFAPVRY